MFTSWYLSFSVMFSSFSSTGVAASSSSCSYKTAIIFYRLKLLIDFSQNRSENLEITCEVGLATYLGWVVKIDTMVQFKVNEAQQCCVKLHKRLHHPVINIVWVLQMEKLHVKNIGSIAAPCGWYPCSFRFQFIKFLLILKYISQYRYVMQ